jgi:hypothetical protein
LVGQFSHKQKGLGSWNVDRRQEQAANTSKPMDVEQVTIGIEISSKYRKIGSNNHPLIKK